MTLAVSVRTTIGDVDPTAWNDAVRRGGGTVFHTHEWLRAYEEHPPAPLFGAYYVLVRRGEELVAVAPLFDVARDPHFATYRAYGFEHPLLERRMLLCHSFYAFHNRFCTVAPREEVAPALLEAIDRLAHEHRIPLYGFPGVGDDDPLGEELAARGYGSAWSEATSALDLPSGSTIDDYCARLRPNRRQGLRRLVRRAQREGVEVSWEQRPGDVDRFADLVRAVCEAKGAPVSYPRAYLHSLFGHLDPYLHFVTLRLDGALLGGFVLLELDGVLHAWIVGLDYPRSRELGAYYVLWYLIVERALELGLRRVEAGRGGFRNKISLGYRPTLMRCWFRATSSDARAELDDALALLDRTLAMPERIEEASRPLVPA